eukprot:362692-Chlamydomonas_euryale.AAC.3
MAHRVRDAMPCARLHADGTMALEMIKVDIDAEFEQLQAQLVTAGPSRWPMTVSVAARRPVPNTAAARQPRSGGGDGCGSVDDAVAQVMSELDNAAAAAAADAAADACTTEGADKHAKTLVA